MLEWGVFKNKKNDICHWNRDILNLVRVIEMSDILTGFLSYCEMKLTIFLININEIY